MFEAAGPGAPDEAVAQEAGLSRATLYRHFGERDQLLAVVFEDTVAAAEELSTDLAGSPDGLSTFFEFLMSAQLKNPALSRVVSRQDAPHFQTLGARVREAAGRLHPAAHGAGRIHADVAVDDLLLTLQMAAAALLEADAAGRPRDPERLRRLLRRGLFRDDERSAGSSAHSP